MSLPSTPHIEVSEPGSIQFLTPEIPSENVPMHAPEPTSNGATIATASSATLPQSNLASSQIPSDDHPVKLKSSLKPAGARRKGSLSDGAQTGNTRPDQPSRSQSAQRVEIVVPEEESACPKPYTASSLLPKVEHAQPYLETELITSL